VRKEFNLVALLCALLGACGGTLPPPKRRVLESDLGGWRFRRYQEVVDVEVYVEGNAARAHTASYVSMEAERRGPPLREQDVINAFVTEYAKPDGVRPALVRFARRLARESGYTIEEDEIGGQQVLRVEGHGETWAFWASGKYVVKVGGRGVKTVPGNVVKQYGRRYPSKLTDGELDRSLEEGE
jgi:hypothetical protein